MLDNGMTSGGIVAIVLICQSVEHQQFRSSDHLTLQVTSQTL